jgi:hypothetical protein
MAELHLFTTARLRGIATAKAAQQVRLHRMRGGSLGTVVSPGQKAASLFPEGLMICHMQTDWMRRHLAVARHQNRRYLKSSSGVCHVAAVGAFASL